MIWGLRGFDAILKIIYFDANNIGESHEAVTGGAIT